MSKCKWLGRSADWMPSRYTTEITEAPVCIADEIDDSNRDDLYELLTELYTVWTVDYCPFCGGKIEVEVD